MLKFPKLFSSKKKALELAKANVVEAKLLEQNSEERLDKLPAVNEGQVTIQFTGVSPANGSLLVGFFVSNGLSKKVKFDKLPLVLLDSNKQVLARQSFDGETIGEISGGSEKACVVRFLPANVFVQDVPTECKVCFDIPVPAEPLQGNKIQYQTLPENTTPSQHQEMNRILAGLPPMKEKEVNFSPFAAQITTQSDLLATVIIRNNSDKIIEFKQMSLIVYDAHREELTRGLFEIAGLTVQPFKALLWTFNFGPVLDREIDLSRWYINVE